MFWHEDAEGGFWCVTRHADIVTVNRDWETYSSWQGGGVPLDAGRPRDAAADDAEHGPARARQAAQAGQPGLHPPPHPRAAGRPRPAGDDDRRRGHRGRVAATWSRPWPPSCRSRPSPSSSACPRRTATWSSSGATRMIGSDDPEYALREGRHGPDAGDEAASAELYAYAQALADDRRANPRDDIVSDLIQAEVDGDALSETDFNLFFLLLAVAGNETTRNAISHSVLALAEHPDQRAWLREDPDPLGHRPRGVAALVHPGHALPPHGHPGHRAGRPGHRRGRPGRDLAHLGQPGRGRVRRPLHASTSARTPNDHLGAATTSPSAAAARTSASAPTWPRPRCG